MESYAVIDLRIPEVDDFRFALDVVELLDETEQPINLTGGVTTLTVRKSYDATTADLTIASSDPIPDVVNDATNGLISVLLRKAKRSAFPKGYVGVYDIVFTDSTGLNTTIALGEFQCVRSVKAV